VREKNRQRHRLRRAEKARSALIEAETIAAHRVQEEEAARLAAKDAAVSGEEEEDTRPASFSAAARLQKRKNGKDKSIRSRSGHDGGRVLTGVNAGASSLVATLLSPRSTASSSSRDVSSGAGGARAAENESFASSFQTSANVKRTKKQVSHNNSNPHTSYTISGGDDWDAGERILATLKTGEDAISFFAKEGNRTAVKFVYLVKSDTGDDFRPYDLDVIPTAQVNALIASSSSAAKAATAAKAGKASSTSISTADASSVSSGKSNDAVRGAAGDVGAESASSTLSRASRTHFVMTEKGLTRMTRDPVTGGILPSEVIPISTWMRESSVFNVVSNMRFFRTYLPRKAFAAWRRAIRLKVYQAQRERLARRLFLARPTFCRPLVKVVGPELSALNQVEVQDFKSPKAFEMSVFAEKQAASTLAAAKRFESCMSLIAKTLLSVCRSCKLRRQHFAQLRERDDDFDTKERNRHKSIVVMKEEKAERDRNERRAQMDFMSLGDLVRLVDYMAVNTLVTVALSEQGKLERELRQPRIKQGLWETTVKFASREDMDAERQARGIGSLVAGDEDDEERRRLAKKRKKRRRRKKKRQRRRRMKKREALLETARAEGGEKALEEAEAAVKKLELEDESDNEDDDAGLDEDDGALSAPGVEGEGDEDDDDLTSEGSGSDDEDSDAEDGGTFITGMRFEPNRASTLDMVRRKNEGVIEMMDQVTRVCHVRRLRTHLRSTLRSAVGGGGSSASSGYSTIQQQLVAAPPTRMRSGVSSASPTWASRT
jgi:hypothetical protein